MRHVPAFYIDDYYPIVTLRNKQRQSNPATEEYYVYDRRHSSQEFVARFKRREDAEAFCEHMNAVLSLRDAA